MNLVDQVLRYVGKREAAQFEKSLNDYNNFHDGKISTYNYMWHNIIKPNLFDADNQTYIGVQTEKFVSGRNHYHAESLTKDASPWPVIQFFSNPLSIDQSNSFLSCGKKVWVPAKDRVVLGRHQIFTFEYDKSSFDFFREQLSWARSPDGKPLNSKIGEIYRRCSQWADFVGITMNHSGSKSFHIHIVFETSLAMAIGIRDHVRIGHEASWRRLRVLIEDILKTNVPVDASLRFPDSLRRFAGGARPMEISNLLGMPKGENVPQLIFWEKYRGRAGNGATESFFQPSDFATVVKERRSIYCKPAKVKLTNEVRISLDATNDQIVEVNEPAMAFLSEKMREYFPPNRWPAYARLAIEKDGSLRAYFRNSATDAKPSSFMDENYATVLIQGANPHDIRPSDAALPASLGEMVQLWLAEYGGVPRTPQSPVEQEFAEKACDKDSARDAMRQALKKVVRDGAKKLNLIRAAEGITKTTSLFKDHRKNALWLSQFGNGKVMYAFLSYDIAEEKCREFNMENQDRGFFGVVLRSFDQAYSALCKEQGLTPLQYADLSRGNFPSKWAGVEATQPEIFEALKAEHSALWGEVGGRKPVFFTVHAVAQRWHTSGTTRLLWAPSFWKMQGCDAKVKTCLVETALSLLIHDELKSEDLIAAYSERTVELVRMLLCSALWVNAKNTVEKNSAYRRFFYFRKGNRPEFNHVIDIDNLINGDHDGVETKNSGEYEIRDLGFYQECIGQKWLIASRKWPQLCADRVLCLTTESVPTEIAEKTGLWNISRLDTPKLERDEVMVRCHRSLISAKMAEIAGKVRLEFDEGHSKQSIIISNSIDGVMNSYTHERAKGSNQFIGKDIIQTMGFKSPDEFERLEALNAWMGSTTLVRQSHIDQFNQSAGRNLNFRRQGNPRHLLIVNQKLWPRLQGSVQALCRYKMVVVTTEHDRRKASMIQKAA